jgi:hypothetical protein
MVRFLTEFEYLLRRSSVTASWPYLVNFIWGSWHAYNTFEGLGRRRMRMRMTVMLTILTRYSPASELKKKGKKKPDVPRIYIEVVQQVATANANNVGCWVLSSR